MFPIALAFVLITVLGLVGNVLVLTVIALNKQMHESTSLFICNLALADLLFLAFCVPLTAFSYLTNSWPFPDQLCYVTVTLQYGTCYVSVWTLVLLAHDRFVSITSPTAGRSLRRSRAVLWICLAVWSAVLALNSLQMRHVGVLRFEYNGSTGSACVDSLEVALTHASSSQARFFYWGFNLGAYLLPLALSCIFYFMLVKEIWRQKLVHTKSSQKMKRHATRMVFVVILTFGACWLPQNLRFFLQGLNYPEASFWEHDEQTLLLVQSIAQTLAYANSCINPILYGLLSERFRLAFSRTLQRLCCRGASSPGGFRFSGVSTAPRTPPSALPQQQHKLLTTNLVTAASAPAGGGCQDYNRLSMSTTLTNSTTLGVPSGGGGGMYSVRGSGDSTIVTEWRSNNSLSSRSSTSPPEEQLIAQIVQQQQQQQCVVIAASESASRRSSTVLLLAISPRDPPIRLATLGEESYASDSGGTSQFARGETERSDGDDDDEGEEEEEEMVLL